VSACGTGDVDASNIGARMRERYRRSPSNAACSACNDGQFAVQTE